MNISGPALFSFFDKYLQRKLLQKDKMADQAIPINKYINNQNYLTVPLVDLVHEIA